MKWDDPKHSICKREVGRLLLLQDSTGDSWSFCLLWLQLHIVVVVVVVVRQISFSPLPLVQGGLPWNKIYDHYVNAKRKVFRGFDATRVPEQPPNNNYYYWCSPYFICPLSMTLNLILKKNLCSIQFIVPPHRLSFKS